MTERILTDDAVGTFTIGGDLTVRRLGFGAMRISGARDSAGVRDRSTARHLIRRVVERGVNFIDTANIYGYGESEEIIAEALHPYPDDLVITTKAGYLPGKIQRGHITLPAKGDPAHIREECDKSLRRLRVDTIDLYQVHAPDPFVPYDETIGAFVELQQAGKIRHIGISNETPWGTMRYLQLAEERRWPRIQSVQNPYNLLNRSFEVGLAEIAHREQTGLLAYSPMAFGVLSGKYLEGARPEGARITLFERFSRYTGPEAEAPVRAYVELAREHGLSPAQMALAYVTSRPFLTANIIGATGMEQLEENLASADLVLDDAVVERIEALHQRHSNPCP